MTGRIFSVKKFAVHDGDGIRTTVFFKGCPLKCRWCHNPEGLKMQLQMGYFSHKCIGCGECAAVCGSGAQKIIGGVHTFEKDLCTACGKCESVCLGEAMKLYGEETTVEKLLPVLLEDKQFYDNSGGGVTLSGGECLMQADFCAELLKKLKQNGINTAVDTCGYVSRGAIERVIDFTDTFLYDIKGIDEKRHIENTGRSNKIILENIKYLNSKNKSIEVRIPLVPTLNDMEIGEIGRFLKPLSCVYRVRLLAYHNLSGSKYGALEMKSLDGIVPPDGFLMQKAAETLKKELGDKIFL